MGRWCDTAPVASASRTYRAAPSLRSADVRVLSAEVPFRAAVCDRCHVSRGPERRLLGPGTGLARQASGGRSHVVANGEGAATHVADVVAQQGGCT